MPRRVARTDPPPERAAAIEPPPDREPAPVDDPEIDLADADLRRDDEDEPDRQLTNGDLARIFHAIGDMLEVKGEL